MGNEEQGQVREKRRGKGEGKEKGRRGEGRGGEERTGEDGRGEERKRLPPLEWRSGYAPGPPCSLPDRPTVVMSEPVNQFKNRLFCR